MIITSTSDCCCAVCSRSPYYTIRSSDHTIIPDYTAGTQQTAKVPIRCTAVPVVYEYLPWHLHDIGNKLVIRFASSYPRVPCLREKLKFLVSTSSYIRMNTDTPNIHVIPWQTQTSIIADQDQIAHSRQNANAAKITRKRYKANARKHPPQTRLPLQNYS